MQDVFDHDMPQLEHILSTERFKRYLAWAAGNKLHAFRLYALNTSLSEALYTPLQMPEVALRNRIHYELSQAFSEDWLTNAELITTSYEENRIADAKAALEKEGKAITPSHIIPKLTFGFWTTASQPRSCSLMAATLTSYCQTARWQHLEPSASGLALGENPIPPQPHRPPRTHPALEPAAPPSNDAATHRLALPRRLPLERPAQPFQGRLSP